MKRLILGSLVVFLLVGCQHGVPISSTPVAYTPPRYRESRVLFAKSVEGRMDQNALLASHQALDPTLAIHHGEPLTIILNEVYMPDDFGGSKDIAVLMDIQTRQDSELISLAVWYQRGVGPGQSLGCKNLTVFSDPMWRASFNPFVRVRVIEVTKDKNAETLEALRRISNFAHVIGVLTGNPFGQFMPLAVRTAGLIVANNSNKAILDYSVQFYGTEANSASGHVVLTPLMRGSWLFIGRPKGAKSDFWKKNLNLNLASETLQDEEGAEVRSPYTRMTVATVDHAVPAFVSDRSRVLLDHLANIERLPHTQLDSALKEIRSGALTYKAHANLLRRRTRDDFNELFNLLGAADQFELSKDDIQFLLIEAKRRTGEEFRNGADALRWWLQTGVNGTFDPRTLRWSPK